MNITAQAFQRGHRRIARPFSGGSLLSFGLGSSIGAYLAWARGPLILALGLVGTVSGFFYTAPPFRFADRGVGELLVGSNFGVLTGSILKFQAGFDILREVGLIDD